VILETYNLVGFSRISTIVSTAPPARQERVSSVSHAGGAQRCPHGCPCGNAIVDHDGGRPVTPPARVTQIALSSPLDFSEFTIANRLELHLVNGLNSIISRFAQ
jgi:hypothetical protein